MSKRALAMMVGVAAPLAALAACGSRTGLLVPGDVYVEPDGAVVHIYPDAFVLEDAGEDVLPPLDATPIRDANNPFCADASDTLVYVVTTNNIGVDVAASSQLLRFDPASSSFTVIGDLSCPDPYGRTPFSMAVNRFGVAYVLYADPTGGATINPATIFRVSLATAQCEATTFNAPAGFAAFGMAFSADDTGNTETLYVASDDPTSGVLGAVNETTLALKAIRQIAPNAPAAELSGSSDGRLFAFFNPTPPQDQLAGMTVAQIDKTTAQLSAENFLPSVNEGNAWAFAFYGGSFYLFTAPDGQGSIVQRYNPTDGSLTQVASWPSFITGAGVSTCAPAK